MVPPRQGGSTMKQRHELVLVFPNKIDGLLLKVVTDLVSRFNEILDRSTHEFVSQVDHRRIGEYEPFK